MQHISNYMDKYKAFKPEKRSMTQEEERDWQYIQTIISFSGINGLNEEGLKRLSELEKLTQ